MDEKRREEHVDGSLPGACDEEHDTEADAVTGASPGTAQACTDLGLNSLEENLSRFGIKPPGMA